MRPAVREGLTLVLFVVLCVAALAVVLYAIAMILVLEVDK